MNQFRFPANVPESVGVPSPGYVCGNPSIAYFLDLIVFYNIENNSDANNNTTTIQ